LTAPIIFQSLLWG